jgi:TPR repeat protein
MGRLWGVLAVVVWVGCGGAQSGSKSPPTATFSCPNAVECQRLCDAKNYQACSIASTLLRNGSADDKARAYALAKLACDHGNDLGCHELAADLGDGNGVTQDLPAAAALFEKNCSRGFAMSCNNLANQLLAGNGVPKDTARAVALYRKGCDLMPGGSWPCLNLAAVARSGNGMPKDVQLAWKLLETGCNAKAGTFCASLGSMLLDGDLNRDPARAWPYFVQACNLNSGWGCGRYGTMLRAGDGIWKDTAAAEWYFRQACALPREFSDYDTCADFRALEAARQQRATAKKMAWKPFRSDVARFSVEMPGDVKFQNATIDGKESTDGKVVSTETDGGIFKIVYEPHSPTTVQSDVEFLLADLKATLLSNVAINWYGTAGAEIAGKSEQGVVFRARIFSVNGTLMRFISFLSDDGDVDHFFSTIAFF